MLTSCSDSGGGAELAGKSYELPQTYSDRAELALRPEAPGLLREEWDEGWLDSSNTGDGYIVLCCSEGEERMKVQMAGPEGSYTYDLPRGEEAVLPLSQGEGHYQVSVFENAGGSKYALVLSCEFEAELKSEFEPFLRPNIYVDYEKAPVSVAMAEKLAEGAEGTLAQVAEIYEFVTSYIDYDNELAASVQSGYVPVLDETISSRKGICFDYASLMAGMLRSLGIPTKLVMGYAGDAYHAWISVWCEEEGWIDKVVSFDGKTWTRMDPTMASAGSSNNDFISDDSNYVEKSFY